MNVIGPYRRTYPYAMPRLPEQRGGQPNPVAQVQPPKRMSPATAGGVQALQSKMGWYRAGVILDNMLKAGNFSYPGGMPGAPVPGYNPAADPSMMQGPPAGSMMPGDPLMSGGGGMPPPGGGMPPMDPAAGGAMPMDPSMMGGMPPPPIPAPPPPQQQPRPQTSDEAFQEAQMLRLMEQKDQTAATDSDITSDVMGSGEKLSNHRVKLGYLPQYAFLEKYLRR